MDCNSASVGFAVSTASRLMSAAWHGIRTPQLACGPCHLHRAGSLQFASTMVLQAKTGFEADGGLDLVGSDDPLMSGKLRDFLRDRVETSHIALDMFRRIREVQHPACDLGVGRNCESVWGHNGGGTHWRSRCVPTACHDGRGCAFEA